jgi:outer membrane protein insertion porin family
MNRLIRAFSPVRLTAGALAGFLVCAALLAQAPTGKIIVEDVRVQGNRLVPAQEIVNQLKTRPGSEYAQSTVEEDIRQLFATKKFGNVQAQKQVSGENKVIVYFSVVEYPSLIQDIVYNGAKHFKKDELNTITGLRKGTPLNPIANQMACQAIVRRYNEEGRPFSNCDLAEGGKAGDTRVVFNITEGPKVKIKGIECVGNTFVSTPVLKTHVKSSSGLFGVFGSDYNPFLATLDEQSLIEYYKTYGFHDVKVKLEPRWAPDSQSVTLVYHIDEGQRYKVAGISLEGVKAFPKEAIERIPRTRAGQFLNQQKVESDSKNIGDYYGHSGRNTVVRAEYFYPADDPGTVQVQYQVMERPPARVGDIVIVGNDVTRQSVILRSIELYPGQILSYPNMRMSENNLKRLGIFDPDVPPRIYVENPDDDNEFKKVIVDLRETHTGSLVFGVGVNSDAGLTGSIVLNERNFDITRPPTSFADFLEGRAFRGGDQEFRAEAVPGIYFQRYTVSLREPSLFDSKYSLETGAYYYDRLYNEYTETRLGGRVALGRRLNQYWQASVALRVEDVSVHNVLPFAPQDFQNVIGDNFAFGIRPTIVRDSRDSFLRPTEGNRFEASVEQVLGDFTYPIVNVEDNQYWTTYQRADGSGRHVLAFHSQVGWAGANTPVYDRFYAGGYRSLRGFEFRGVGPDAFNYKLGGDFMLLSSLEYSIPLVANEALQFVTFVDSGTVERRLEMKDYRVSAGVGLRIAVPMLGPVPIALDLGFPIVKGPGDNEQVFSFWLGFFR